MKIIALLPMKGHSARVPNKNMRNFADRPLFHTILETLLKSQYIERVIINTDSNEIVKNAVNNFERIVIHRRSSAVCGDMVSMNDVIATDLERIKGADYFLQTHSTNPLISAETIDDAISTYFKNLKIHDSLFSVNRLQTRLYWENGKPVNHNPNKLLRTQDLPPIFEENSNLYIFSKSSFYRAGGTRIGVKPMMYIMDQFESIDIDNILEFQLAEIIYKIGKNKRLS